MWRAAKRYWKNPSPRIARTCWWRFRKSKITFAGLRILAGQAEQVDAAVVSARRSADLAQKLYQAGRSSYLDLLDAQRNLAAVERSAVLLRGDRAVTTVALIRSLGGGWDQVAR